MTSLALVCGSIAVAIVVLAVNAILLAALVKLLEYRP